jgi:glycosyltransferase involved in cell wall biosynthesis
MLVDLRENRGTEQVFLNLIKYKPEDTQIGVVIPNISYYNRIETKDLEKRLQGISLISASLPQDYYSRPKISWPLHHLLSDRRYSKQNTELKIKLKEFDVLYLFYNRHSTLFERIPPILVGSEHTMPVTGLFSGNLVRRIISFILNKRYFDKLIGIHIFPSEEPYKEKIIKRLGIKHVFSLPNGIDLDLFNPTLNEEPHLKNQFKIFFVASLEYSKGFDIFLDVANIMNGYRNVEFHVVGVGPMAEKIASFNNITYHRFVTDQQLSALYKTMDIFLYPTRSDSFPLVVLQALASGLLILTSKNLSNVFHEFNNISIEFLGNEPNEYAAFLKEILENPQKLDFDKKACFDLIKAKYDWKQIASDFYKQIELIYASEVKTSMAGNNEIKES